MAVKRTKSGALALFEERLAESGLTRDDAKALGLEPVDSAKSLHPSFDDRPAMVIRYRFPTADRSPPFFRVRYLGPQPPGFADQSDAKPRRYAQEPGTGSRAYFPAPVDWGAVFSDPSRPIVVTEGELKAASAAVRGYPTIGLGGVWNFRSAARGVAFLPELEAVPWRRRTAYLVFDSDLRTNPKVAAALNAFARELSDRGALPELVFLPELAEGRKTGLDDFLVAAPPKALDALLADAAPVALAEPLFRLSDEVTYVRDPGLVVVRATGQRVSPAAFTNHAYANRVAHDRVIGDDGSVKLKPVSAAKAWLAWPPRAEVARLTYSPGQPAEVEEDGETRHNLWPGWGVEPRKGDAKPFLRALEHVFAGAEPEAVRWFVRWLACPLQRPGTKMHSSVLLWSPTQGVGKSLFGYTMKRIYGRNFVEIGQDDLESSFTEWAENKQFVLGDEVTGSDQRRYADKLKKFITQETMRINVKMIPTYVVPDRVNYLFTSNHPDAFFLDDQDRRYFVHEVTSAPLPESFFEGYFRWLDDEGGAAALFRHLLDVDLGDFNPKGWAFRTAARDRMVDDGKSDVGAWVAALKRDPGGVLRVGEVALEGDLFTARELFELYDPAGRTRATANGVARELRRAGFRQVLDGATFRGGDGRLDRFYAVRDRERWDALPWSRRKEVEDHLRKRFGGEEPRKKRY